MWVLMVAASSGVAARLWYSRPMKMRLELLC